MAQRGRSAWATAGDAALTVAAVLGAVCIVVAIAAAVFDVRIVLFRTGSMSPTIPAGSAAIVHGIPATDVGLGDVVMVDRPGELPVTHRVVGIEQVAGDGGSRLLTLRGDANPVDDPAPYAVSHVRRVVVSMPGVAPVFASLGSPWVLGSVTIAATVLIVAVFWPRRRHRPVPPAGRAAPRDQGEHPSEGASGDAADPAASSTAASSTAASSPAAPSTAESRSARRRTGTTAALGVLLAAAALITTPSPARAATTETVVQGSVIRLVSIEQAAMQQLAPGGDAVWNVGVTADADSPGVLTVTLSGTGDPGTGLRYAVQGCPHRWTDAMCAASEVLVADAAVPTDGEPVLLQTMPDDAQLWLRIEVALPGDAAPLAEPVQLVVRATGVGDDVATGPDGGLAATGGGTRWVLPIAGLVAIAIGTGAVLRTRRRT